MNELKIIDCINHARKSIEKYHVITKEQRLFGICVDEVKIKKLSEPRIEYQTEAWGAGRCWRDLLIMDDTGEIILRVKISGVITKEKIFSFAENDLLKIIDVVLVSQYARNELWEFNQDKWRLSTIPKWNQSKIFVNDEIYEYEEEKKRKGRIKADKEIIREEKTSCPVCGKSKDIQGRSEKCRQCFLGYSEESKEEKMYSEDGLIKDLAEYGLREDELDDDDY